MPAKPLSETVVRNTLMAAAFYVDHPDYYWEEKKHPRQKSVWEALAKDTGLGHGTVKNHVAEGLRRWGMQPGDFTEERADYTDDDLPDPGPIKESLRVRNTKYIADSKKRWRRRFIVKPEPFALGFVGDPHLDNVGCDHEALERDLSILRACRARCIQMGDILDFFHKTGKLSSKQATSPVTAKEGLSLARDLVRDSGVWWDAQILGNHDIWAEDEFATLMAEWAQQADRPHRVYSWMAELTYDWGDGHFVALAAHDFKGHSIYNPLHGNMRRALQDGTADLHVAAHRHTSAKASEENAFRGKLYHHCRVSGYKAWDGYAFRGGYGQQEEGRSALAVINPLSESMDGRCRIYFDLAEGAEWLETLRRRG